MDIGLKNVERTYLVQASGKPVLQKNILKVRLSQQVPFSFPGGHSRLVHGRRERRKNRLCDGAALLGLQRVAGSCRGKQGPETDAQLHADGHQRRHPEAAVHQHVAGASLVGSTNIAAQDTFQSQRIYFLRKHFGCIFCSTNARFSDVS